jgi:hypothetical protein
MERISPVNPQTAQGKAKELLDAVKAKLGIVPNMTRAMAVSPPVLDAYLGSSGTLIFTNYFNNVAGTAIDFPKAPALSV